MAEEFRKKILLVEDDPLLAVIETRDLRSRGYEIIHVSTGEQAVQFAVRDKNEIDLILMDINLGDGIDGTEATEIILKERDIPVVFLSSHIEQEIVGKTENLTSYGYVVKNSGVTVIDASIKMAFRLFEANNKIKIELAERKKAEAALKQNEAFIRSIMDNLPIGISVNSVNPGVCFEYINDNFIRFYRTTREALAKNDNFWEAVYEDEAYRSEIKKRVIDDINSGNPEMMQWSDIPITRTGEKTTYISAKNVNVPGRQMLISTVWDVTERKKAEDDLKTANNTLQAIFDNSPIAIYVVNMESIVLLWNRTAEEMFGWKREEVINRQLQIIPDEKKDEHILLRNHLAGGGLLNGLEVERVKKDGSPILLTISASPLKDQDGNINSIIIISSDITEKRKMEEEREKLERQLLHSQKMETVGLLAGGIAHDFNNLLTPIIGYSELSMMNLDKDDQNYNNIKQIRHSAELAKNLTQSLLAFSRKQILELKELNIRDILEPFSKMLRRTIRENVQINMNISEKLGYIRADSSQIEQVLLNLCINAQDAMPEGGTLTIDAEDIEIKEQLVSGHMDIQPGTYIVISVSDTGSGMDSDTQKHIFEPFYTTKGPGKGTGLGLSTVYGIIKQHGGSIYVYSEKMNGTVFKIYLPEIMDYNFEPTEEHEFENKILTGNEILLVAEDDEKVRKLSCGMLEKLGYTVIEAENVDQCVELSEAHDGKIDLLISDVIMPKMNGRILYDTLKKTRPELKVLFVSGYTHDAIAHHGVLDEGMNFLQKPFTMLSLSQKVRKAIES